jgi:threonine/homoserine efflux transporter RhtA
MNNPLRSDKTAHAVRFGCGAFFGAVIGIGSAVQFHDVDSSLTVFLVICLASVLLFGCGAAKAGDEFWHWIGKRWWWF